MSRKKVIDTERKSASEELRELCTSLGISTEVADRYDSVDIDELSCFADREHFVSIDALFSSDVYSVYVAEGKPKDFDHYGIEGPKTRYMLITSLNACEEGPNWEEPLKAIKLLVERDLEILKEI